MPTPTFGVMTLYLGKRMIEELPYFRKLSIYGNKLGLSVFVFTPEDVDSTGKQIRALFYNQQAGKWTRKLTPLPDVVYDRCRYQRTYRFQLLRKFRSDYPKLLYMSRPLVHKWAMHQILYKNPKIRPNLPETETYQTVNDLKRFLKTHRLVYLKPIDGTGGRGILRIEHTGNGSILVQGRDRSRKIIPPKLISPEQLGSQFVNWELKKRYLIQQGISLKLKDGRIHDYRLLIQKNGSGSWEVTGCAGRIGPPRSITSNLHGGGMAVPAAKLLRQRFSSPVKISEIQKNMGRLAFHVVNHLEKQFGSLCELALDIAVDPEGDIWLLEINPKPAREVFHRIGEADTYRKAVTRPLEYALYLYNKKID